jgi:hypothetical protein
MAIRVLGIALFGCSLALTAIGMANATPSTVSTISPVAVPHVPELDPAAIGSGIALLAGGIMLLAERRRAAK